MDNNQNNNQTLPVNKFLTRRNIFIVLGLIIALEVLWALWSLTKGPLASPTPTATSQPLLKPTAITLTSSKTEYKAGEPISVDVNISSAKAVDGVDLIISFDPKILTAKPSTVGAIFSEYPQNSIDTSGKISISGITAKLGGVRPEGKFATLNFSAKAAGTSKIALDFTPGLTGDTNVTENGSGKDILEEVNDLEITILP